MDQKEFIQKLKNFTNPNLLSQEEEITDTNNILGDLSENDNENDNDNDNEDPDFNIIGPNKNTKKKQKNDA